MTVQCSHCGLIYVNPQATPETLAAHYSDHYHAVRERLRPSLGRLHDKYARQASELFARLGPDARVVDVGCAEGEWLAYQAQHPYRELIGIEVSTQMARIAQSTVPRALIHCCQPVDAPIARGTIHYANIWHVLEHTNDPMGVLTAISSWLRPDGELNIGVPSGHSMAARLYRVMRPGRTLLGEHLWLFAPRHVVTMVERAGLTVTRVRFYANRRRFPWPNFHANFVHCEARKPPRHG